MSVIRQWILAALAVCGAFFVAGIGGSLATDMLGFWHLPGAGFCAALAVVLCTNFAAPSHKLLLSCCVFAAGAVVAWAVLEPSWYPENHKTMSYKPTHLPVVATYVGGIIGLVAAGLLSARTRFAARKP